ncbi:MAG: carbohydrate kinase family protein [Planctomycetota bacterium]
MSAIICFGEVLWDCLPRGLFLGGAPMNVAYHLHALGREALPVSAIGNDFLGAEVLRRLTGLGLQTPGITHTAEPTGVVRVSVDADGQPSYDIVEHVAWDRIDLPAAIDPTIDAAEALVFGSLAQRSEANRAALASLLDRVPGMKAFDVNLRAPYDDLVLVRSLAARSDLVKLNDHELARLQPQDGDLEARARALREECGCAQICVTAGAQGAGLLAGADWHWAEPEPITVRDAVGAGDSFMAALIDGLLARADPGALLHRASRLAEFVAMSDGATPDYANAPATALKLD